MNEKNIKYICECIDDAFCYNENVTYVDAYLLRSWFNITEDELWKVIVSDRRLDLACDISGHEYIAYKRNGFEPN